MDESAWEPFNTSLLEVGDGHVLYFEEVGNPTGTPIVYLHGGPGSGATVGARRHFDDWATVDAGRFFPAEWEAFSAFVPDRLRDRRLVDAYHELVMDPDPAVHAPAARAWCRWEDRHMATTPGAGHNPRYDDPRFRLGFARQVTHCWSNNCWLTDDELVRNAERLAGIRGTLVHGRLDVSSPLWGPWQLHKAWPGSELLVVDDEGHGGPDMQSQWRRALLDI